MRALVPIIGALALAACPPPGRMEGPLSPAAVLATIGDGDSAVRVLNGGYGSALVPDPDDPKAFFLLTDRGPNVDGPGRGQKLFPVPSFAPRIGRFRLENGVFVLRDTIILTTPDGSPLTGFPQPAGPGSTSERAVALDGTLLGRGGYDPNGFDAEGLALMPDGSFWVSDEYGPYLLHVDPAGRELARVSPFGGPRPLPAVLAQRRPNCGMEGLAALPDGRTVAGIMQCPLENPLPSVPGIRRNRLTRLVLYDTRTGASRQYVHLLDHPEHLSSEIAALGADRFLVIERDLRWPGQAGAFKRIHAVEVRDATDVTGDPASATGLLVSGRTLEEIAIDAEDPATLLATHGIRVAGKTLVSDLVADLPGWSHDKPEGLAVLDDSTLAISNDDDFAIASSDPVGRVLRKINPVTGAPDFGELRFVRLGTPSE
ncbi:MAG: esterase-like activity of phytase family protein [Gemmatimonadales bacterium]